jgi:type VI secretion system secreted protein Hcp
MHDITEGKRRKGEEMKKTLFVVAFVIGLHGFIDVHKAYAQHVDVFMLIPPIRGDSLDAKHKDWIDVVSLRQTLDQAVSTSTGARGPTTGPTTCEVETIKLLDRAGPLLWAAAVTGNIFTEVRIEVTTKGVEGDNVKIYEIRLLSAQITSISTVSEGTLPLEKVVLRAPTMILSYFPLSPSGIPQAPITSTIGCIPDKGR